MQKLSNYLFKCYSSNYAQKYYSIGYAQLNILYKQLYYRQYTLYCFAYAQQHRQGSLCSPCSRFATAAASASLYFLIIQ